ncbi:MAG: signal peptidase I [Candidatus Bipolaricaulota bacterium]|nr:signal peptidase I [Candidatus Bipolaricaulota bacterium]
MPKKKEKKAKRPALLVRLAWRLGWKPGRVMREVIEWTETLVIAGALAAVIMTFVTVRMHVPTGSMIPTIDPKDSFFVDRITYYFRTPKPGDIVVFRQGEVAVRGTEANSIAAAAHVSTGVKLVFVNGKAVRTVAEANAIIAGLADGTTVRLELSDGRAFNLAAKAAATSLTSLGVIAKDAPTRYVKRLIAVGGQTVQIRDGGIYIDGVRLTGPRFDRTYVSTGSRLQYGIEPTLVPEGMLFMLGDNSGDSFDSRYWGFVDKKAVIGVPYLRVWPISRFGPM